MIRGIEFENFKGITRSGYVELKPVTILIGPNSGGKTTLIQALLIALETAVSKDLENLIVTTGEYLDLGSYSDFVYAHDLQNTVTIRYVLDPGRLIRWPLRPRLTNGAKLFEDKDVSRRRRAYINEVSFKFKYVPRARRIILYEKIFKDQEGNEVIKLLRKENNRYYLSASLLGNGEIETPGLEKGKFYELPLEYSRKRGVSPDYYDKLDEILYGFRRVSIGFATVFSNFYYIGPLREYPLRVYPASGQLPANVGGRGERAIDVLYIDARARKKERHIVENVKFWLKKFGMAAEVELKPMGSNYFQLNLLDPFSKIKINLRDVGFGVSQILPIIIQGYFVSRGTLTLLEQPEIHLHPKVQGDLGDLIVNLAIKGNKNFVIETHSGYLLRNIRRNIEKGVINNTDVALYYCNNARREKITRVTLNESGQLLDFPDDYMAESVTGLV